VHYSFERKKYIQHGTDGRRDGQGKDTMPLHGHDGLRRHNWRHNFNRKFEALRQKKGNKTTKSIALFPNKNWTFALVRPYTYGKSRPQAHWRGDKAYDEHKTLSQFRSWFL